MTTTNRDWETLIEELQLYNREHQTTTTAVRLRSHKIFACNTCIKSQTQQVEHFKTSTTLQGQTSTQLIILDKLNV